MHVAVMGAGAVGCYFGAMLARAGHAVTLIARPAHVTAVQAHGLRLETAAFDAFIPVNASTSVDAVAGADLVLVCVKSFDTEAAGAQMRPHLPPGAKVLCLQNGVDNALRLQAVLPHLQISATVVYVATEMAGAGHVRHHGRGDLVLEPSAAALVQPFAAAGIPAVMSENVRGALWLKLILNCAYNAISAITRMPYGRTVGGAGVQAVMQDVVRECLAIAQADGVQVAGDVNAALRMIADTMPGQMSSTAQDLARGKPGEIDYLNGFVVRRGEALGIATPVNRVLWSLVKLLESREGN